MRTAIDRLTLATLCAITAGEAGITGLVLWQGGAPGLGQAALFVLLGISLLPLAAALCRLFMKEWNTAVIALAYAGVLPGCLIFLGGISNFLTGASIHPGQPLWLLAFLLLFPFSAVSLAWLRATAFTHGPP